MIYSQSHGQVLAISLGAGNALPESITHQSIRQPATDREIPALLNLQSDGWQPALHALGYKGMEEDNSFYVIASISSSPFLCVLKKWTFYYLQIDSQENALLSLITFTTEKAFKGR